MRFVWLLFAAAVLSTPARGQAGLARPNVGPGQGPRTDYHDEDWEYWWFLNSESILATRRQERLGDAAKPPVLTSAQIERMVAALESSLVEANPDLRSAALVALAKTGSSDVLPRLLAHLDDPSLDVRRAAAQSLGVLGDAAATAPLVELILDKKRESDVRRSAALALGLLAAHATPANDGPAQREPPAVPPMTPLHLRRHEGGVRALAWSPDGRRLASAGRDGSVRLFDVDGEERTPYASDPLGATHVAFSPDGEQICVARADGLRIWSTGAARELNQLAMPRPVVHVAFDPERGERVLVSTSEGEPQVWSTRARRFVASFERAAHCTLGSWRNDADRVAFGTTEGFVSIAFPKSGRELAHVRLHDGPVVDLAWAADGESFVSVGRSGQIQRADAAGKPVASLHRFEGPVEAGDFHPDGRTVAAADSGGLWIVDAIDSTVRANVRMQADVIRTIAWSPDGTRLAVGTEAGDVRIYEPPGTRKPGAVGDDVVVAGAGPAAVALAELLAPNEFFELERTVQSGLSIAAGVAGDPALATPVEQLLNRKLTLNRIPRAYLILSFGRLIDDEQRNVLFDYIEDDDVHARRSAAIAIGRRFRGTADAEVMKRLAARDRIESDVSAKNFIAIAMGRVGSGQGPQPLLAKIQERRTGVLAHNGVVVAPRISLAAKSRLPFAAIGLGLAQDRRGFEDLGRAFEDERDHSSRAALGIAAGLFGDQRAARSIRAALKSERDPILAGYLALAAGLLGDAAAAATIEKLLEKAVDEELVPNAAIALHLIGGPSAQRILMERLDGERRPGARSAVLYALARVGNADAFDSIIAVLDDHEEPAAVRAYAAVALGDLAAGRAVRRWASIIEDFNYQAEPDLLDNFLATL